MATRLSRSEADELERELRDYVEYESNARLIMELLQKYRIIKVENIIGRSY